MFIPSPVHFIRSSFPPDFEVNAQCIMRLNKHSNHRNTDETLNIKLNTFAENSAVTVVEGKPMRDNAVYKSC